MEDWTKWLWALLIGAMIVLLLPRAKAMVRESPKARAGDWQGVVIPILLVIGFVLLLMSIV